MQRQRICLGIVTFLLLAASAALALEPSQDPNNPTCDPKSVGCRSDYPTSELSKGRPEKASPYDPTAEPTCRQGAPDCAANQPTAEMSKKHPAPGK